VNSARPSRGEIWLVNLNPTRGHEQAGIRPCLIVSADMFNHGPAGLVTVIPLTTRRKKIRSHVEIRPPEAGVREVSFAKTEDIRSIDKQRLMERWGVVSRRTMQQVEDLVKVLLDLP